MPEEKKFKLPKMEHFRVLPKFRVPLVGVEFPDITLPEFPPKIPKLDRNRLEVLKFAVMEDVSDLVPVVGDAAADLAYKELTDKLTPEEHREFREVNKLMPSSLAVLKIFAEREKSK